MESKKLLIQVEDGKLIGAIIINPEKEKSCKMGCFEFQKNCTCKNKN